MKINLQWVSTLILLISALFVGLELRQSNAIAKAGNMIPTIGTKIAGK